MTLVANRPALREKAGQLKVEPGVGCHGDLDWSHSPRLSWLPAHPISRRINSLIYSNYL